MRLRPFIVSLTLLAAAVWCASIAGSWRGPADGPSPPVRLADRPLDPLAPFHLELGLTPADLRRVANPRKLRPHRTAQATYQHLRLGPAKPGEGALLPAPEGLQVLEADFFFEPSGSLTKAAFLVRAESSGARAERTLRAYLGNPDFEVAIPGQFQRLVGWKTGEGALIARFSDLPVFQVTVTPLAAQNDLAAAHLLIFDGLKVFSRRLAAGDAPAFLMRDYLRLVLQENRIQ